MNIARASKYIKLWLANIDKENVDELEQEIEIPLHDLLLYGIENLYQKYSDSISFIPVEYDPYSDYIIAPKDNKYPLDDFLINRLLRSVQSIIYVDNSRNIIPCSSYDHDLGEILIDKNRLKNKTEDVGQKKKIVLHEFFHGIKAQFTDGPFYNSDKYYQLKEQLKKIFKDEINDFDKQDNPENAVNIDYLHCGLQYPGNIRMRNSILHHNISLIDEGLNEVDSIACSNDTHCKGVIVGPGENIFMIINNPESSNMAITNYAYILERLVGKDQIFIGLYLDPQALFNNFRVLYEPIFQECFNSNLPGIEILANQLAKIKEHRDDVEQHTTLLNAFSRCFDTKHKLLALPDDVRQKDIKFLTSKGLLEMVDDRPQPLKTLSYYDEYMASRNKPKV